MAKTINKKTNKEIENEKDPQKKMLLQEDYDWYLTYDKKKIWVCFKTGKKIYVWEALNWY